MTEFVNRRTGAILEVHGKPGIEYGVGDARLVPVREPGTDGTMYWGPVHERDLVHASTPMLWSWPWRSRWWRMRRWFARVFT